MKKLLLIALFTTITSSFNAFSQCAIYEVPLSERVTNSEFIIEGKVISQHSFWNEGYNMIYTVNEIKLYKVFKGVLNYNNTIEVVTVGGVVGLNAITAHPALELRVGDIGVFTANHSVVDFPSNMVNANVLRLDAYADQQGFIKYNYKAQNAFDMYTTYWSLRQVYNKIEEYTGIGYAIINAMPDVPNMLQSNASPTITGFSPDTISAGTESVLTIIGTNFGSTQGTGIVEFKDGNNGGSTNYEPLATQYVSWSDTEIRVMVPSRAGTGKITVTNSDPASVISSANLTISFSQLNPVSSGVAYKARHIDKDGNGGYIWHMEPKFDDDSIPKERFLDAMEDWRCGTFINWENGDTTHVDTVLSDGVQVVRWGALNAGVLGVCFNQWSGCFNASSDLEWWVNGMDIVFDSTRNWYFGNGTPGGAQYDFQSVAVHELGHGHQLGHVIASGEIMHYSISNGQTKRNLSTNDIAGGDYVMNQSTVKWTCAGAPNKMTPLTVTTCGVGIPHAGFKVTDIDICVNEQVTFTDTSDGNINSWNWDFGANASPATAMGKGPHNVSYTAGGIKSVELIVDGPKGADTSTRTNLITVTGKPNNPSITGANTVCKGSTQVYNIPTPRITGHTYKWILSGGGTISGASNDTFLNVTWSTVGGPYQVSLREYNQCDSSDLISFVVGVGDVPGNPSGLNVPDMVCKGQQTYMVGAVAGATSYEWTLSNGGSFVGGTTGNSITVDWTTPGGIYTLSVKAKNACGLSTGSSLDATTVLGKPNAPSGLDLAAEYCVGTANISVTNDANITAYKWTLSGGGTITSADNVNPITIDWTTEGGPYTVTVKQYNMCDSSTITTKNTLLPQDVTVDFTFNVNQETVTFTNTSTNTNNYTWSFGDGVGTSGTENPSYKYPWPSIGTYDVKLKAGNACYEDSVTKQVTITTTSINKVGDEIKINIYPNPLKDKGTIRLEGNLNSEYTFDLYDVNGKLIKTLTLTKGETTMNVSELVSGVYFYHIREGEHLLKNGKLLIE